MTDPEVGDGKSIWLCPAFWTAATSAYLLPPKDGPGPSEPVVKPFKSKDDKGWCQRGRKSNWFATAGEHAYCHLTQSPECAELTIIIGHTILHELTHLDSLASVAGLEPDNGGRHGTLDYKGNLRKFCELSGARNYLGVWESSQANPEEEEVWDPTYNAESYAGMATGRRFITLRGR